MKWHLKTSLATVPLGLLCLGWTSRAALPGDELSSAATMALPSAVALRVSSQLCCDNRAEALELGIVDMPGTVDDPRGIPVGLWTLPPDMLGSLYNGAVLTGRTPFRQLEEVKSRKGQVVLYLARKESREGGIISVGAVQSFLATWPDITPYIRDGTVWGIMVSDDITGKDIWGPDAPYYPQIDSIAMLVKQRWPEARTIVRAPPTKMNYQWKWVGWAWAQYSYARRNGDVEKFRDRELAKANSLGLCVAFGLNVVDGGNGSSGKENAPGKKGGRRHQMSPDEVLKYSAALLPYTPVAFYWEYRPALEEDPAMREAMAKVRSWADTMPRPSCRNEKAG
jgi:hypothetical protein